MTMLVIGQKKLKRSIIVPNMPRTYFTSVQCRLKCVKYSIRYLLVCFANDNCLWQWCPQTTWPRLVLVGKGWILLSNTDSDKWRRQLGSDNLLVISPMLIYSQERVQVYGIWIILVFSNLFSRLVSTNLKNPFRKPWDVPHNHRATCL